MKIQALRGYALVEPLEVEDQMDGVYLPDRMQESQPKGKVLCVGKPAIMQSGSECVPEFKEGDIVYHKRFVDNKIKDGDRELLLIPFTDVLAIING